MRAADADIQQTGGRNAFLRTFLLSLAFPEASKRKSRCRRIRGFLTLTSHGSLGFLRTRRDTTSAVSLKTASRSRKHRESSPPHKQVDALPTVLNTNSQSRAWLPSKAQHEAADVKALRSRQPA